MDILCDLSTYPFMEKWILYGFIDIWLHGYFMDLWTYGYFVHFTNLLPTMDEVDYRLDLD